MDPDALLDGLNDAQRRAVVTPTSPLCILAGAGSGKTRVLTRRIAHRVATGTAEVDHVLALTFTRKAAGELAHRLRALGLRDQVAAGTFHAVAYAQLRTRWAERSVTPPQLLDRKFRLVADVWGRRALPRRPGVTRETVVLDLIGEIEWAKARRITPSGYPTAAGRVGRRPPVAPEQVGEVFGAYEAEKKKRRLVDFDDLLRLCLRDLERDETFAAAQRWRFRHLFVDEYQDVNPLQHALLEAWRGGRPDLCVVGDPNQAIYSWNGADSRFLDDLAEGRAGGEVVTLVDNYRSSPQILRAATAVVEGSLAARQGKVERRLAVARLRANRPDGPPPTISELPDERAEAAHVARAVRDAHAPGSAWSSQAVLVRTNAQTGLLVEALRAVQVPCRVRGRSGLLDLPEVRSVLRDLGRGSADFDAAVADLESAARGERSDADEADEADGHGANLAALVELAREYRAIDRAPTVPGFLAWVRHAAGDDAGAGTDAVEVLTFHAAKGLEWPTVHLAGLERGLVPIGHATTAAAQAEERRLFYVAVTRAGQALHCTWARQRTFGTKTSTREPSPYLDDVAATLPGAPERLVRPAARTGERGRPASVGRAAGALSDLSAEDRALFDDLKAWRLEVSRAAKAPAYTVFNDATLGAIARRRPRTTTALLDVPGVGAVKVGRWGAAVLDVVERHSV